MRDLEKVVTTYAEKKMNGKIRLDNIAKQCSLKRDTPELIRRYLYVIMRAYFICVLNTIDEGRIICRENCLNRVDSSHYSV